MLSLSPPAVFRSKFSARLQQPRSLRYPRRRLSSFCNHDHNSFTMRGLCRLSVTSSICRPRFLAAEPQRQAVRSIYTLPSGTRAYGFRHEHEQQRRSQTQYSGIEQGPQSQGNGHSGFLPVPFVTEQLAGAHHTTDLFSRLLKERIVAVYGPVEDRMVSSPSGTHSGPHLVKRIANVHLLGRNNHRLPPLPRI